MWKLGFDTIGGDWPPVPAVGRGEGKTLEVKLETILGNDKTLRQGQIRARVKAKRGVSVSEIDVRSVVKERHLKLWPPWKSISFWDWRPITPVSIEKLTDAHAEHFREELGSNDYPTERFSGVGKVLRYPNPKNVVGWGFFLVAFEYPSPRIVERLSRILWPNTRWREGVFSEGNDCSCA
ncbi:hypothetical protein ACFLUD_01605 [Chloroflexota bacterium]